MAGAARGGLSQHAREVREELLCRVVVGDVDGRCVGIIGHHLRDPPRGWRPGGAACGLGNMVVTHLEPVSAILHPHTHEPPPLPVPRDAAGHRSSRPPPFQSGACPRKKHEDALYGDFEVWGS